MWHLILHALGYFMLASLVFTLFLMIVGGLIARRDRERD
jgi:hypothetical protein